MDYEIIRIRTALDKDSGYGGLSFLEGEKDIPFPIKRFFSVYEAPECRRFQTRPARWRLLFCPYGAVNVTVSLEAEPQTVTLDEPAKGLILRPGLGWSAAWRQSGSVLCVAESEDCGPGEAGPLPTCEGTENKEA